MSAEEILSSVKELINIADRCIKDLKTFGKNEAEWTETINLFRDIPVKHQREMAKLYRSQHSELSTLICPEEA